MNKWEVAHGPKNDYPHILLKDTPWWVDKRGITFLPRSTFVSQKIRKNCTRCRPLQTWRTLVRRVSTQKTSLLKSAKAGSLFFFLCICIEGIGKSFKLKTRIFPLNSNSQQVFKDYQYFMASKSIFGAFFQDTFYLCGITPNYMRFTL